MKINITHITILILIAFTGCIKPPEYPVEPEITAVSISNNMINQFDSLRIILEFTDGDGDIGQEVTDPSDTLGCNACDSSCLESRTFNLFLTDSRTGCLTQYKVPFIPEKGSSEAISGEISVVVSGIFCVPKGNVLGNNPPYDTLVYFIQLKDRAGNLSKTVEAPEIIIDC